MYAFFGTSAPVPCVIYQRLRKVNEIYMLCLLPLEKNYNFFCRNFLFVCVRSVQIGVKWKEEKDLMVCAQTKNRNIKNNTIRPHYRIEGKKKPLNEIIYNTIWCLRCFSTRELYNKFFFSTRELRVLCYSVYFWKKKLFAFICWFHCLIFNVWTANI